MADGSSNDGESGQLSEKLDRLIGLYNGGHQVQAISMLLDMTLPSDSHSYDSFTAIGGAVTSAFKRNTKIAIPGAYWSIGTPRDEITGEEVPIDDVAPGPLFALRFVVAMCNDDFEMARAMYDALLAQGNAAYVDGLTELLKFSAACIQAGGVDK